MSSLIKLSKYEDGMRVSSQVIADGMEVDYKSTNRLINKHKKRLETFGELRFEIDFHGDSKRAKPALLNEDQAYFLLTLSRNSEKVVEFKHRLVTAFSKLRRKQALIDERHAKSEWQQNRSLGKYQRKNITDSIQQFIDYAQAQGSRGAIHYFVNITKCVNKALCIDCREEADEEALHLLATAEAIAERVLLGGMADALPYKTIFQGLKQQMTAFAGMVVDD